MIQKVHLRNLRKSDCLTIPEAFQSQGSEDKIASLYERYFVEQEQRTRDIIVATIDDIFVGYVTVLWHAGYLPFKEQGIPEIVDFNVLKKYQRLGIGTALMDAAEARIKKESPKAGIGFGVFEDYGAAQVLYTKRGYIPDGRGIVKDSRSLQFGEEVIIDHSLAFYLTKEL